MNVEAGFFVVAIVVGLGATLLMDVWNWFLKRAFGVASLNYCLLGRWLGNVPRGVVRHESISAAPAVGNECALGWLSHYTIGATFALAFALINAEWFTQPTLLPALLYGIATVIFPFFIMQPAIGLGVASARAARPLAARTKSLATHLVFGVGMYGFAVLSSALMGE